MSIRALLWLALVLGLVSMACSAWVAIAEAPLPGDVRLTRDLQDIPGLERTAELVNAAGTWRWAPFAVAVAASALGVRIGGGRIGPTARRPALTAFAVAAILWPLGELLKVIVQSPRPTASYDLAIDRVRDSYGFPSGHVYGDVLIYGVMAALAPAYLHPRLVLPARVVLCAVIVMAGPARVAVGAHWPSDTLGGYLWGATALCVAIAVWRADREVGQSS